MQRAALLCIFLSVSPLVAAPKQLFNGKNLDGWQFVGRTPGAKGFEVKDGSLQITGTEQDRGILVYTREKLGNMKLRVVYMMSNEKGNSGVFIRIPDLPKSESDAINKGIEVQIDDRDNDWHCTGTLYSMTKAMARPGKAGQWNTMEIELRGLRTVVRVNGVLVTDYDGTSEVPPKKLSYEPDRGQRPEMGYIALQHHDESAVISFKEISAEPLR
jgi:Domain of Unknown Function (DUF1080)